MLNTLFVLGFGGIFFAVVLLLLLVWAVGFFELCVVQ